MMIASTVISATGSIAQGKAQSDLLESDAEVAGIQAEDALTRGRIEEMRLRERGRGLIGQQRAGFTGQHVSLESGSALDVVADTARLTELDALTVRNNAALEAWGYRVEQENLEFRAEMAEKKGIFDALGQGFSGAANILGGP
jgi:hypothetical protein